MFAAVRASWALLMGILLLTLGQGLQGTLLGVRATIEAFPVAQTGLIMTGYSLGFLAGALVVPRLIKRVGHIRVFAALGSIASCAILLHPLMVEPVSWFVLRFVTGATLCGVFIVSESWLNSSASNEIRGQILSVYLVVQMGGFAGGQLLLNLAPPAGFELFIVTSLLLSLAIVPILLTATAAPPVQAARRVSLAELYAASPLGLVAIVAVGIAQGAIYHMGAVYAREVGFSVAGVSVFMALTVLGGMVFQWPVGFLSDKFDRRFILTIVTFLASATALFAAALGGRPGWELVLLFFLAAGMSLPMYGLCVAHVNDFLSSEQMVGASGTLLLAYSIGSIVGPMGSAAAMQAAGTWAFPLFVAVLHGGVGVFALWRMTQRAAPPLAAQGPTIPLPTATPTPTVTAMAQEAAVEQAPPPGPEMESADPA